MSYQTFGIYLGEYTFIVQWMVSLRVLEELATKGIRDKTIYSFCVILNQSLDHFTVVA